LIVPVRDWHLTGHYCGAGPVTIVADFQKVAAFPVAQWSHRPIVDDQDINAGDTIQQLRKASIGAGDSQIL
jgi:hypothetical protein